VLVGAQLLGTLVDWNWMMQVKPYTITIGSTCEGLLLIAELTNNLLSRDV
jgi:hypothetical protein